jgi:hypothetical protein
MFACPDSGPATKLAKEGGASVGGKEVSLGDLVPNRVGRFDCDGRLVAATRTTVEQLLVMVRTYLKIV